MESAESLEEETDGAEKAQTLKTRVNVEEKARIKRGWFYRSPVKHSALNSSVHTPRYPALLQTMLFFYDGVFS